MTALVALGMLSSTVLGALTNDEPILELIDKCTTIALVSSFDGDNMSMYYDVGVG